MSVRYGISLILEPAFTAGLHRARQVICSQYGCWAAEMHSVHVPLTDYFACPEQEAPSLGVILGKIAEEFRGEGQEAFLTRQSTVAETEDKGSVYLAFADGTGPASEGGPVGMLRADIAEALSRLNLMVGGEAPALRFALLQHSGLPAEVFRSAARFAEGVVDGLELPGKVAAAELALFRFESAAADEEWSEGSWASDLTWRICNSYELT
ncbi:MAG: hypothetical protein OXN21_12320 [Chloroflexota bacterium]|nr:hypothetical protein [Chloroflexota bacterium]